MNKTLGYIIGALALGVTAFAIGYGWKKGTSIGGSNFTGEPMNASGQSGTNTCKPPRKVIGGSCVLPGNTQKSGSTGATYVASMPKMTTRVF